jgi:hypothetical protein
MPTSKQLTAPQLGSGFSVRAPHTRRSAVLAWNAVAGAGTFADRIYFRSCASRRPILFREIACRKPLPLAKRPKSCFQRAILLRLFGGFLRSLARALIGKKLPQRTPARATAVHLAAIRSRCYGGKRRACKEPSDFLGRENRQSDLRSFDAKDRKLFRKCFSG